MGLIGSGLRALFGGPGAGVQALGQAVTGVAGAFTPNATRRMELGHDAYQSAHASHMAEFAHARPGRFDAFVNGLNRLPRPFLAIGTLGLFTYAMTDPPGFSVRMQALHAVPEPLWWLLGAVVAFYFGAREAHHLRWHRPQGPAPSGAAPPGPGDRAGGAGADEVAQPARPNPALDEWRRRNSGAEPPSLTP
ncbi:MAG: holin family protein [Pararhodobacter sp.]|nr:holin family protein [Pararhodobacter sp.]